MLRESEKERERERERETERERERERESDRQTDRERETERGILNIFDSLSDGCFLLSQVILLFHQEINPEGYRNPN